MAYLNQEVSYVQANLPSSQFFLSQSSGCALSVSASITHSPGIMLLVKHSTVADWNGSTWKKPEALQREHLSRKLGGEKEEEKAHNTP